MKQTIIDNRNRAVRVEDRQQAKQALRELRDWIVEEVREKRRRVFKVRK